MRDVGERRAMAAQVRTHRVGWQVNEYKAESKGVMG